MWAWNDFPECSEGEGDYEGEYEEEWLIYKFMIKIYLKNLFINTDGDSVYYATESPASNNYLLDSDFDTVLYWIILWFFI